MTSTDLYADTIEHVSAEEAVALSRAMDVEMTLADALVKMHNDQDGTEAKKCTWQKPSPSTRASDFLVRPLGFQALPMERALGWP